MFDAQTDAHIGDFDFPLGASRHFMSHHDEVAGQGMRDEVSTSWVTTMKLWARACAMR